MRLINADELMEHVWRDKLDSRELIAKMIDDAPTVKEITTNIPISVFEKLILQELKWVPVSERLPGFHKDVLLSLRSLDIEVGFRAETEPYFYCHGDYIEPQNVLAWMPLPEPYEAKNEVEEIMAALEQQPCEDAISRQVIKEQMIKYGFHAPDMTVTEFVENLPPATPQPKTGYWIADVDRWGDIVTTVNGYRCSECNAFDTDKDNYCPSCGLKMEVKE